MCVHMQAQPVEAVRTKDQTDSKDQNQLFENLLQRLFPTNQESL